MNSSKPAELVLIVDDNPTNLQMLSTALTDSGIEVAVATDGEMAIEQAAYDPPGLILLDIAMPGIGGFETCRRLKESPATRDIPVIFMTALADTADKVKGLNLGAVDYITKPFQYEEVLARIRVQLTVRSLTRSLAEQNAALQKEAREHAATTTTLEQLKRELEQRVEDRTAELSRAYAHVERVTEELRSANERLEREVTERTEELSQTAERLKLELAERERAEDARAALQEEIIQVQRERLAELSTPLIPISDRIVVMPLIGVMDTARARQALETALNGVQSCRAEVVIVDVTGVTTLDADVAGMLVCTASALRLLGALSIVTGIRPDVAQALVSLDIDLGAVVMKSTLQSGIAHAMDRCSAVTLARRRRV